MTSTPGGGHAADLYARISADSDLTQSLFRQALQDPKGALARAVAWRAEQPVELLGFIALGQALAANGQPAKAARAYGSVIDFFPSRADIRRLAGEWLETLGDAGLKLAAATYRVAAEQRPDHPAVYHLLALTLARLGEHSEALEVAIKGITAKRAFERFNQVDRILKEDAQLVGAAWAARAPQERERISQRLAEHGLSIDARASIRFVLNWETDANDVDFHIYDKSNNHAFYSSKVLPTGGELYADITTGYGPECFTIYDPSAFPYRLQAHYYSRGPMGYGAGKLQVIRHDGAGGLMVEDRPFVIMVDGAYVDLGVVKGEGGVKGNKKPKIAAE